ncbi:CHASE domain-containing protein [Chitiniphilus purpureus]|uniref:CHASE domain-containing protein n=1 Tax=Chitiniphilus purpureus TaxID=2981137 RepID=A0ABY6DNQ9_9NEIS|nr:CHASE domain-containing protein [Chitiniphilus sp. CD1]UXY15991.1 CHASE domain-containing protein [Chitiniphilus sp. CD1]
MKLARPALLPVILALLTGVALTTALDLWLARLQLRQGQARLAQTARLMTVQLEARVQRFDETLRALRGAFIANPELDRATFAAMLDQHNFLTRQPGFLMLTFVRHVPAADLAAYLAGLAAVEGLDPDSLQARPPGARPAYYFTDYIYPSNTATRRYVGYDIAAQRDTLQFIGFIRDRNLALFSAPLRFTQLKGQPLGYALYYPVYQRGMPLDSVAERRTAFKGLLVIAFRSNDIFDWVEDQLPGGASMALWDTGHSLAPGARTAPVLLGRRGERGAAEVHAEALADLPGRQWRAVLDAPAGGQGDRLWVWLLGGSMTVALAILAARRHPAPAAVPLEPAIPLAPSHAEPDFGLALLQAVDMVSEMVVVRDASHAIVYGNRAVRQRFETPQLPLLGRRDALWSASELVLLAGPVEKRVLQRGMDDGREYHYAVTLLPLREPAGYSVTMARDISRGRARDLELTGQLQRLTELLDVACDWHWTQDAEHRLTGLSEPYFQKKQIDMTQLLGRRYWEFSDGGISSAQWEAHKRTLAQQLPYRDFVFVLELDQHRVVVSLSGRPCYDPAGRFTGYRGVGRDVTAARQAQEALLLEKTRTDAILDALADGVVTTDPHGLVQYFNPVAAALLGWTEDETLGKPIERCLMMVDVETRLPLPSLPRQVLGADGPGHRQRKGVLLNKFGLTFSIHESVSRITDPADRMLGVVVVLRDETHWVGGEGDTL